MSSVQGSAARLRFAAASFIRRFYNLVTVNPQARLSCHLADHLPWSDQNGNDQAGLGSPVELPRPAGAILLLAAQGGFQALLHEALADADDGGGADVQGVGDPLVGPGGAAVGGVGLEQDAGVGELPGSGLAGGDQLGQLLALLGGQRNLILLHGFLPEWCPGGTYGSAALKSKVAGY